jgi:hypothetical protein
MASYLDDREDYEFFQEELEEHLIKFLKLENKATNLKYQERLLNDFIQFATFEQAIKDKKTILKKTVIEKYLKRYPDEKEKTRAKEYILSYLKTI